MKSNLDIINKIITHEERRFGKDVHGTHYNQDHNYQTFSPITFIEHIGCSFELGNVVKYVYRFNRKNKAEDLLKALTYVHYAAANSTIGPSQAQLNEVRDSKSIYSKNAQDYIRASLTDIFKQHDPEIANLIVNIFYNIVDASTTNIHDKYLELLAVIATDIQKILETQYRYTIIDGMNERQLHIWVMYYIYISMIGLNDIFNNVIDYDDVYKHIEDRAIRFGVLDSIPKKDEILGDTNKARRLFDKYRKSMTTWIGSDECNILDLDIKKLAKQVADGNIEGEFIRLSQRITNLVREKVAL